MLVAEETLTREPTRDWLIRSLARFWVIGVIVVCAFGWADWSSEDSVAVNLFIVPLVALLLWGFVLLFVISLSALLYLGVVALLDGLLNGEHSRLQRRAVAVAASPLVGFPWWLWAWGDEADDPGFVVFLAVICLAFGLMVPLRRFRQARRPAPPTA